MANPLLMFSPENLERLEREQEATLRQIETPSPDAQDAGNPLLMFSQPAQERGDGGFTIPLPSTPYTRALGLPTAVKVPGWLAWLMRQFARFESATVKPLLDIHHTIQDIHSGEAEPMDYLRSLGRVPKNIFEGFVAEEPHSYYDLLDAMFPDTEEWIKVVASLPLSVLGDPLSYISVFKRMNDGRRVAVALGDRTLIQGERLTRAMESLWDFAKDTPLGRELRQKFSRNIGPAGYAEFRDDFIDLLHYRVQRAQEQGMSFYEAVQQVSKETGLTPGEISQLWERPVVTQTNVRQVTEQVPVDRRVVERAVGGEDLPTAPPTGEVIRETVRTIDLPTEPFTYKVQRGDTLSQIAQRNFVTVEEIMEANPNITDPNRIRAGQNITIPVPSHMRQFRKTFDDLKAIEAWHIQEELRFMRNELMQSDPGRRIPIVETGPVGPAEMTGEWIAEGSTFPYWYQEVFSGTSSDRLIRAIDSLLENPDYRQRSQIANELWELARERLSQGYVDRVYGRIPPDEKFVELLGWQQEIADDLRRAATVQERERIVRTWEERMRTEVHKVEVPVLKQAPPQVQELIAEMRAWNEMATQRLEAAGIPVTRFEHDDIQYLAHRITPEARKILAGEADPNLWTESHVRQVLDVDVRDRHLQRRTLRDMTIQEANEWFMEQHGVPLFIDDPAIATTMRVVSAEKAATSAEFLRSVTENPSWARRVSYRVQEGETLASIAEKLGTSVDELVERNPSLGQLRAMKGTQTSFTEFMSDLQPREHGIDVLRVGDAPAGWRSIEGKRFGDFTDGFVFEPEVAKDLQGYIRLIDPDELNVILSYYDRYMNIWKMNALAWYPGYHFRNVVGNILNNWAAGVKDPRVYEAAFWAWRGREGGAIKLPNKVTLPDGRVTDTLTYRELADLAARHGARGRGQYATVSDMMSESGIRQRTWYSPFTIGGRSPSDYAFMVQEAQEDWTRMAHFLDRLLKGDTPREAAASVRKYLFDYTEYGLTEFERTTMRRLVPFYTWTRNNLPLQLELLFTRPGYAATHTKVFRTVEGLSEGEGVDPEHLDEFIAGGMPLRVGTSPEGMPRYWRSLYWLPFADLAQISTAGELGRFVGSSVTPVLQAPIEAITGRTLHFGGDVERYPGQITTVPGLPDVPVESRWLTPAMTLLPGTRALYEIQRTNPFRLIDPDDPRSAAERAAAALGVRLYTRDPDTAAYWARQEWKDTLLGMLSDYRRQDGPRTKAAIFRQVRQHLDKEDLAEWDMNDIRRLVDDIQSQIRSAAFAGDHEHIRFLEDILHDILRRI